MTLPANTADKHQLFRLAATTRYYRTTITTLVGAGLLAFASSVGTELALATARVTAGGHVHFVGAIALPFLCLATMVLVAGHAFLRGVPRALERLLPTPDDKGPTS